jgi:dipeptidyl aminopeptidase/acylaminoacyl peptidase
MPLLLWNGTSSAQEPLTAEDYFGFHEDRLIDVKINKEGTRIGLSRYIDDFSQVIFLSTEDFSVQGVVKSRRDTFIYNYVFIEENRIAFEMLNTKNSQNSLAKERQIYAINTDGTQRSIVFNPDFSAEVDYAYLESEFTTNDGSLLAIGYKDNIQSGELISTAKIIDNSRATAWLLNGNIVANRLANSASSRSGSVIRSQLSPLNRGSISFDNTGTIRAAGPFGSEFFFRKDEEDWIDLSEQLTDKLEDDFDFLSFSDMENQFYFSVNDGKEYKIYRYDADTADSEVLYTSDRFIPYTEELVFAPTTKTLIGVSIDRDDQELTYLVTNEASELDKSIRGKFPDKRVEVTSHSLESNYALVRTTARDTPDEFFLYDKQSEKLSLLGNGNSRIMTTQASNVSPFFINNAQGKSLNGFVFFPKEFDSSSKTIILPLSRRSPIEHADTAQFLAEQGILVIQLELSDAKEGFINPDAPDNFSNAASDISYLIAWAKQNKLIGNAGVSLVGMDYIAEPALEFSRDNPEELASLILLRPKFPEAERLMSVGASELKSYSKITIPTLVMTNELDDEYDNILKDLTNVIPNSSTFNSRGAPLSALNIGETMARQSEFILQGR